MNFVFFHNAFKRECNVTIRPFDNNNTIHVLEKLFFLFESHHQCLSD